MFFRSNVRSPSCCTPTLLSADGPASSASSSGVRRTILVGVICIVPLLSSTLASAQEGQQPPALEVPATASVNAAIDLLEVKIELLESEQVEFRGLATGALQAAGRGDIEIDVARELSRASRALTTANDEEIRRLEAMVSAGLPWGIPVAVFPVAEVTEFVNSWGFARSGGRRHKGTDVLAPNGANLFAIEGGLIERQSNSQLGGLSVYLLGDSGARYYYTHLSEMGPQAAGDRVEAGEVLGFVGDSGNARGTPHLHFQWAPDGKTGWQNPYPLLEALWVAENNTAPPVR